MILRKLRRLRHRRYLKQIKWERDSFAELAEALGRTPTRTELLDFLDKGGSERGS